MRKQFTFTVDDNVIFLRDLTVGSYKSIFDHPYLAMYRRLHEKYGIAVQLNLFYEYAGHNFDLSQMTERYLTEWQDASDWLKLSFHSRYENVKPYESSDYGEVYDDCAAVHREILRFAGNGSLASTTTVHCCLATKAGIKALYDNGVRGLLGLYGTDSSPRMSYQTDEDSAKLIRRGETRVSEDIAYANIDMVINTVTKDNVRALLEKIEGRKLIKLMIHEQYFYEFYKAYQPDFEAKLEVAFSYLTEHGYESVFFEDTIKK